MLPFQVTLTDIHAELNCFYIKGKIATSLLGVAKVYFADILEKCLGFGADLKLAS